MTAQPMTAQSAQAIRVRGLEKSYQKLRVLRGVGNPDSDADGKFGGRPDTPHERAGGCIDRIPDAGDTHQR